MSARTFAISASTASGRSVAAARKPKAPAFETAATSSGVATQPIPVWMIGNRHPRRSHRTVWRAGCMAQPSGSRAATPVGSRRSRSSRSSSAVGARVSATVAVDREREAGLLHHLVPRHAGMQRDQPHRVIGRARSRRRRGSRPRGGSRGSARRGSERGRPVVADARDHVDLRDEGLRAVVRDPVAGRMVDRVARRAAHAEQLRARLLRIADAGDVLVAEAIDLGGAHHHVAPPGPERDRRRCDRAASPRPRARSRSPRPAAETLSST